MKPITSKTLGSLAALCTISMLTMSANSSSYIPLSDASPVSSGDTPSTCSKTGSSGSTASTNGAIFSSNSLFWYAKIPDSVQLNVNSDNYVTEFLRQLTAYYGAVTINTNKFSAPVYVADASTPTVSVAEWDCQSKGNSDVGLAQQWSAVPVPAAALPSNDSDAEMVIYQPSTDTLWEFWKTRMVNGNWQGCWGGRMQNVSQSIGNWTGHYGATATGLSLMGGMITPEELQSGAINHVIGIALVDLETFGIFSWPAVRSDGWNPTNEANRIPAGARFRLDPTVNVDTLNMTPAGKMIAKAAQTYGFVVWDKAGAISLRAKDPKSYTQLGQPDPYPSLYNSVPTYAILNNFPWNRLQFLPMDYGKNSFWYAKIPASVQLNVNSDNYVTEFLRQLTANYGTVAINTNKFSAPVYVADASTPTVSVTEWDCQSKGYSAAGLAQQWSAVPVPAAALPSNDTDAEMVIYQPSTDTLWEFWKARKVHGNWQGCWGGRMQNVSQSIGNWTGHYGATATGLPLMGGMITPEELQSGAINHVIGISLVDLETNGIFSWPAVRSDGWNPTNEANRIPAGARFRLDPNVNVDTLNMTPVGKMIAKAAQTYGFVVWDKAGAISLRAKDPKSYTQLDQPDPYPSLYNSVPTYAILNNFPWNRLQFLPMDYGKVSN